ncbi:MAG TPA: hypothetical protein DDW36_01615 [Candidatus Magasanikbacteria bacterium]|nr:hypothetical protein [Candidatus Magasanikbacteria bacterium]
MPQNAIPPTAPVPTPGGPPKPIPPQGVHPTHSRLTEHFEQFHRQSKIGARKVLIASGLTAFLIWAMMEFGWIDTPWHIMTPLVWIGSMYVVYKI